MRRFMVAAAVLALVAAPASAQMGGGKRHRGDDSAAKQSNGPKVDEKAYKAALDRIPEPKEKYDPWSGSRPAEPEKKK